MGETGLSLFFTGDLLKVFRMGSVDQMWLSVLFLLELFLCDGFLHGLVESTRTFLHGLESFTKDKLVSCELPG